MCSRVLGLAREQIFAALFGAGTANDAFIAAFRAPNLLRDLFAEGALSTAFITTFSKKIQVEGDGAAWRLANKMCTLLLVFMSAVTLLGIVLSPQLIQVLGHGYHDIPGKFELTVSLTRIMYPFILLVSLAALAMGMLNAKSVFGAPALASSFFNLGSIVGGVGVGWMLSRHYGPGNLPGQLGAFHFEPKVARQIWWLYGMAIGTLLGGFLQFVVQLPSLAKAHYRFRFDFGWDDPGVRTILRLMGPAVIAASAVQVNVAVNTSFASDQGNGAVSWLNSAFRLMQLPLGMFGVAIATVTLPLVSKSAAVGDVRGFRTALSKALRLAFFLTIPSAIGLVCLGEPIISLLYQHGHFTVRAAHQTAAALQFYAIGLAAYSGIKVLAPAFYALDARTTPMTVSFVAIAINVVLNIVFTRFLGWGHRGLAFSTSVTAIVNFSLLYLLMRRRTGTLDTRQMAVSLGKLAVAGAFLAFVCLFGQAVILRGYDYFTFPEKVVGLFGVIGGAGAVFFGACYLMGLEEMHEAIGIFSRKWKRR